MNSYDIVEKRSFTYWFQDLQCAHSIQLYFLKKTLLKSASRAFPMPWIKGHTSFIYPSQDKSLYINLLRSNLHFTFTVVWVTAQSRCVFSFIWFTGILPSTPALLMPPHRLMVWRLLVFWWRWVIESIRTMLKLFLTNQTSK